MGFKHLFVVLCLGFLTSCCCMNSGGGGCGQSSGYGTCQCADPYCRNNTCISSATCCEVYGNIGGQPRMVSENWDATYALDNTSFNDTTYSYRTPYYK